jgi:hypothetical protein
LSGRGEAPAVVGRRGGGWFQSAVRSPVKFSKSPRSWSP